MIQKVNQFCTTSLWPSRVIAGIFATTAKCQGFRNASPAPEAHISKYETNSLKRFHVIDLPDKLTFTVLNK